MKARALSPTREGARAPQTKKLKREKLKADGASLGVVGYLLIGARGISIRNVGKLSYHRRFPEFADINGIAVLPGLKQQAIQTYAAGKPGCLCKVCGLVECFAIEPKQLCRTIFHYG